MLNLTDDHCYEWASQQGCGCYVVVSAEEIAMRDAVVMPLAISGAPARQREEW